MDNKIVQRRLSVLNRILLQPTKLRFKTVSSHTNQIEINKPPIDLQHQFNVLFTPQALTFLSDITSEFDQRINQLHWDRFKRRNDIKKTFALPEFSKSVQSRNKNWKIDPLPQRLRCRLIDVGDVSPANRGRFFEALRTNAPGIQVDFDDGHCPTWRNQIYGLHNIYSVIHGQIDEFEHLDKLPILIIRPRAWNMIEHNIMINGKKLAGPLVDFAIFMFHNAQILTETSNGPFFYLPKLESASEAKLWNEIFVWSQKYFEIPQGTIKACVLIENILSSFEMDDILFELRQHSFGLNCGIWDYSASIISIFGDHPDFIIPDRNLFVDMEQHFLSKYMELLVGICRQREAPATGGMAAQIVTEQNKSRMIQTIINKKEKEMNTGCNGFILYDTKLVRPIQNLLQQQTVKNQATSIRRSIITERDLLTLPKGYITINGLKHNIEVSILFIYNWMQGRGTFEYKGSIEDSATAEISRSQIWQWIRHQVNIEENGETVTKTLVEDMSEQFTLESRIDKQLLNVCKELFLNVVTSHYFVDFITTFLNDSYIFQVEQNKQLFY